MCSGGKGGWQGTPLTTLPLEDQGPVLDLPGSSTAISQKGQALASTDEAGPKAGESPMLAIL